MATTTRPMRLHPDTHDEATQIAALRRVQPSDVIAEAWREYMEKHREEFAKDLETLAELLRDDTINGVAEFVNRTNKARAAAAVKRLNGDGDGVCDDTEPEPSHA
ncbi:MAG TPA: hypothetical protein VNV44_11690 [Solirubrobacteraceae bacterium]|jgi:hypothetical protein|nr:hypothetical protein [Solirubrobacteraceae bacterium]